MLRRELHGLLSLVVVSKTLIDASRLGAEIAIGHGNEQVATSAGDTRKRAQHTTRCGPLAEAGGLSRVDLWQSVGVRESAMKTTKAIPHRGAKTGAPLTLQE